MDTEIGRLVERLRGLGLERRSLLAFSSDHGRSSTTTGACGTDRVVHNAVRPSGKPEFELLDFYEDPLDRKDLAKDHPEVVERLAKTLESWKLEARAARLKGDEEAANVSAADLERLHSLGYVR